jgi:phosphoribosyl 1,2-cyclic phosphodiesterase
VKLWMLGSGSSGNAVLIECDGTRLLVDCGFGPRTLAGRLNAIGIPPESIDGCILTHDHTDHICGAAATARRWGWGVYATPGTAQSHELRKTKVHLFDPGMTLEFPRMTVSAIPTPHDAIQSVGFVVTSRSTGARAGLFYDLGCVTRAIAKECETVDILVLESNHDDDMLRYGPYPPFLQARIAGRRGHLSNREAGVFARDTIGRGMNHLVLAHLSENCNTPSVALRSMRAALARTRFKGGLTAAVQNEVVGPFLPGATRVEPAQYSLF